MSQQLTAAMAQHDSAPVLVGILTGGLWLAKQLAERQGWSTAVGEIDIGFHRDDFQARGLQTPIRPSRLNDSIDGRTVILIDDVLHTGRTVRAAINALFEYGRPQRIVLAVLVSRPSRQLPIQADIVGTELSWLGDQRLKLDGPDPLHLRVEDATRG